MKIQQYSSGTFIDTTHLIYTSMSHLLLKSSFLYYNLFNIIHAINLQAEKEMTQFPLSLYRHSAFMLLHIQLSYIRKKIVVCVLGNSL